MTVLGVTPHTLVEALVALMLVLSGLFGLIGSFGLMRLPTPMMRLHAPTLVATVGVGMALLAAIADTWLKTGSPSLHELMIMTFLFLTAPITAHFIAKAHLHRNIDPDDLPPTGRHCGWATFEPNVDDAKNLVTPAEAKEAARDPDRT